jgi:4-aminobutyrate aminotransferase-like enzyme
LVLQLSVAELALDEGWPLDSGPGEGSFWQQLLINPAPLLKLPNDCLETGSTSLARNLARRRKLLGSNLRLFSYKDPIQMARGWRHHLFDAQGRRFLDAYNNVPHVGHCHPRVIAAAVRQMQALNTNTRYLHEAPLDYAESLTARLPVPLRVCFFVNSGSEANELAIRLARAFTGARDMLVMEQGYHGNTNTAIDMSEYKFRGPGGAGQADWVHLVPLADPYGGAFRGSEPAVGTLYADALRAKLAELDARKRRIAGFICETLPSVGGQIVFPSGYLEQAYAAVRAAGGVCIADEVQTGLGRLGTHFWGFAAQEAVPDIVVMGKPLGNGHPMAAVVTTAEIAAAFDNGMEFFSTFGGNTVSATIGLEVLRIIDEERLQAHALSTGERLKRGLQQLCETHAVIGDVRGLGLFLGMELVSNREERTPATDIVRYVVNRLRQEQILVGTEGRFDSVIKIRPPLTFDDRASDRLVEALDGVLGEDFVRRGCC